MSCTASINPLSALPPGPLPVSTNLSIYIHCLSSPQSALSLSPKHLTCSAFLLMDSAVTRSNLVSAKGNLNVFISPSCSSAPCLFLQALQSLNHATPPSTTTILYTVVFIPADALYCTLHLTLFSIGSTRLLQLFLHSPSPLQKKKKGGGSLNIDEF